MLDALYDAGLAGDVSAARTWLDRTLGAVPREEPENAGNVSKVPTDDLIAGMLESPDVREAIIRHLGVAGRSNGRATPED